MSRTKGASCSLTLGELLQHRPPPTGVTQRSLEVAEAAGALVAPEVGFQSRIYFTVTVLAIKEPLSKIRSRVP